MTINYILHAIHEQGGDGKYEEEGAREDDIGIVENEEASKIWKF